MSNENLIGVDPLDWMNKSEVEDLKKDISNEDSKPVENSDSQKTYHYKLDNTFDIRVLDSLCMEINNSLNSLEKIEIDLSDVSKVDAASVQFLTSLKKTADDKMINFELKNPNEYFKKSIDLLGLSKLLH